MVFNGQVVPRIDDDASTLRERGRIVGALTRILEDAREDLVALDRTAPEHRGPASRRMRRTIGYRIRNVFPHANLSIGELGTALEMPPLAHRVDWSGCEGHELSIVVHAPGSTSPRRSPDPLRTITACILSHGVAVAGVVVGFQGLHVVQGAIGLGARHDGVPLHVTSEPDQVPVLHVGVPLDLEASGLVVARVIPRLQAALHPVRIRALDAPPMDVVLAANDLSLQIGQPLESLVAASTVAAAAGAAIDAFDSGWGAPALLVGHPSLVHRHRHTVAALVRDTGQRLGRELLSGDQDTLSRARSILGQGLIDVDRDPVIDLTLGSSERAEGT